MVAVKTVVQSLEDAKAGKPIVEGLTLEKIKETHDLTIGILEAGMTSGRTSLMFCLKMPDDTYSIAQMSAAQFEMVIAAVRGATQRFEDESKR